ncbi:MAG: hypothetical protein QOE35_498 [Actinomycetota bacterium]
MSTQTGRNDTQATRTAPTDTVRGGYETPAVHRTRATSTETRKAFRTTEFFAFVVVSVATLIAAYSDSQFDIDHAWTLVAIITFGYMLSRGIAKAGSREPRYDDSDATR